MEAIQTHHLMKRAIDSNASQDCVRSVASPKPNQVGTVLLYGIPIVSLYIESQERLCLAQISNTLLKQFSYNEIHNRRVALGITCVQCTPVQLEILRRAGAMPVSSRRCGMITRREAERLCKSFLGDNAPPRLPDDFAFSVHHECAWGCRGSFLPSRYNSSRAKCIKCSYCGLFFSPNKFIFHSHRIGPGDKYVQPDAANFNSWRRHMKLSGDPPEEIVHAWEDVKAMFNGGTRKRLITASPNSSSRSEPSPKRIKETAQITPPLIHAAAAAAVASATVNTVNSTSQFPVRPINIHHPVSVPSTNSTQRISNLNPELQLPFSRTFMMDYMWHHTQNKSNPFQFSSYALPWMKRPGSLLFGQQQTLNDSPNTEETSSPGNSVATATGLIHLSGCTTSTSHVQSSSSNVSTALNGIDAKVLPTFYNNSAFKPVINHQGRNTFPISVGATAAAATVATSSLTIAPVNDDQRTSSRNSDLLDQSTSVKESLSSDDEMVDIETTEEEQQQQQINMKTSSQCFKFKTTTGSPSPISINIKIPPSSPTIEIENSTEIVWDGFLKKEHQTTRNLTNIDENGKLISALVPNVSTINLPHLSPSSSASSIDSIEHQSSSSTNLLCKSPSLVSGLCCNIIDNSSHHSHHHHQHQHHHHQHQHHHQSMKKTIFIPSSVRPYNNTSLSTPSSSTTTDIRLSSRLAAGTGSPAPSSLPPPLPQSISSAVHSPPSPSTPSSNSSMNSGSAAIASSPSSSAAVVAAAAAAAVAIAAFNTQQHHHHQHNHHQQHCSSTINSNSNSNNLLSNSNNSNNCSSSICSSQMLNIAAVTAINNQRLSMVNNSTSVTASAAASAGTSNAGASASISSTIASVTSSTNNQMNNNNNSNIVNNLSISGNNMISNSSSNGSSINNGSNNSSSSCNTNNSSSNNNNSHNNLHNDNILHSNQNLTYAINNHICNSIKNKTDNCINSKHSNYSNNNNTISNNNLINKTLNNDSSNNNSSTNNNNNNSEFWSVTRFSFEPPTEYRLSSFYKHDITKHFHTFRHGETTTQSNGIG